MSNTKKTSGPSPQIERQGHTAGRYGSDPDWKGKPIATEKKRDLKP